MENPLLDEELYAPRGSDNPHKGGHYPKFSPQFYRHKQEFRSEEAAAQAQLASRQLERPSGNELALPSTSSRRGAQGDYALAALGSMMFPF